MRVSFAAFAFGLLIHHTLAKPSPMKPRRTSSILINPGALPDLPSLAEARSSFASGLNLDEIQGDILVGMKKNKELFFFFEITDVAAFKSKLGTDIHDRITPTAKMLDVATQPVTAVNIAFSHSGLTALGVNVDDLLDTNFQMGQLEDAPTLGDPGTGNWVSAFVEQKVHGVFLLASDTQSNIDDELKSIQTALGGSITELHRLQGAARPGDQQGHEHFGYMDGVSQPAIEGFLDPEAGQFVAKPGAILLGEDGDGNMATRPSWTKSGSFLAFRQLKQRVPEFNKFVADNALSVPGLSKQENIDLFGARTVGRWKSGAPIDLSPLRDDPVLGNDHTRNNNFTFDHPELSGFDVNTNQTLCPFSAHIAKIRPRAFLSVTLNVAHIMRAGIPYGPEVTDAEAAAQTSSDDPALERGLAFVAYQSSLANGFTFLQRSWANNANFPKSNVGVDPIIGSTNSGPPGDAQRTITGLDPTNFQKPIVVNEDFVVSRGGEYFFSPPISALINPLSQ
ncbi:hypothetical protein E1B28_005549 [Marasmius oreades]|uniref:Uncharacterized protein n=1 Tax=Marasmius oreades TaxID=181124 RepID=A0A9P7UUX9_9AGAR|nr:uncharacterized protein E1B28_005549 [Marasmius oreades]KAG7094730.1 hypothetical protein E1B28_005549 [Marasmius oreades]